MLDLIKAGGGERSGHKYVKRESDGKGGWRYFYRTLTGERKQHTLHSHLASHVRRHIDQGGAHTKALGEVFEHVKEHARKEGGEALSAIRSVREQAGQEHKRSTEAALKEPDRKKQAEHDRRADRAQHASLMLQKLQGELNEQAGGEPAKGIEGPNPSPHPSAVSSRTAVSQRPNRRPWEARTKPEAHERGAGGGEANPSAHVAGRTEEGKPIHESLDWKHGGDSSFAHTSHGHYAIRPHGEGKVKMTYHRWPKGEERRTEPVESIHSSEKEALAAAETHHVIQPAGRAVERHMGWEKSMDAIDALGVLSKGKKLRPITDKPFDKKAQAKKAAKKKKAGKVVHPTSEAQRKWAFAAEQRGEIPKGKALEWSRRAKAGLSGKMAAPQPPRDVGIRPMGTPLKAGQMRVQHPGGSTGTVVHKDTKAGATPSSGPTPGMGGHMAGKQTAPRGLQGVHPGRTATRLGEALENRSAGHAGEREVGRQIPPPTMVPPRGTGMKRSMDAIDALDCLAKGIECGRMCGKCPTTKKGKGAMSGKMTGKADDPNKGSGLPLTKFPGGPKHVGPVGSARMTGKKKGKKGPKQMPEWLAKLHAKFHGTMTGKVAPRTNITPGRVTPGTAGTKPGTEFVQHPSGAGSRVNLSPSEFDKKAATGPVAQAQTNLQRVMGGPMRRSMESGMQKGGLWSFTDSFDSKNTALLPQEMLFDLLVAFICEAYEHEKQEHEHNGIRPQANVDIHKYWAKCVMGELVQILPKSKNLMAAVKKHKITADKIADILREQGIVKPPTDAHQLTDRDSWQAMGAKVDGEQSEVMEYSRRQRWMGEELEKATPLTLAETPDSRKLVELPPDVDPFVEAARAQRERISKAYRVGEQTWRPNVHANCPIHGFRDLTKTMNLNNSMAKCLCS